MSFTTSDVFNLLINVNLLTASQILMVRAESAVKSQLAKRRCLRRRVALH